MERTGCSQPTHRPDYSPRTPTRASTSNRTPTYNGTLANAITFRAWDQTSGSNGTLADTSTNGGTTAFSTATDTASLVVTAVNDAPVNTVPGAQTVNEDTALAIGGVSVTDVDGNLSTVQLAVANGTVTVSLAGGRDRSAAGRTARPR